MKNARAVARPNSTRRKIRRICMNGRRSRRWPSRPIRRSRRSPPRPYQLDQDDGHPTREVEAEKLAALTTRSAAPVNDEPRAMRPTATQDAPLKQPESVRYVSKNVIASLLFASETGR